MRLFVLLAGLLLTLSFFYTDFWVSDGSFDDLEGVRHASSQPIQKALLKPQTVRNKDFTYKLSHSFEIKALVLSKKSYRTGVESIISPVDLALGWGKMSNPNPVSMLKISQSGRFYRWRYENAPPIPHNEIIRNSANMHLVPASKDIESKLNSIKKGDVIHISGYLMSAKRDNGWRWKSSLTRNDQGKGACELVYVKNIKVINS